MGTVVGLNNTCVPDKKQFSDFADEPAAPLGEKCKIDDILNVEIEILWYRLTDSKFPKGDNIQCVTMQIRTDEGLKKVNRYYTLS